MKLRKATEYEDDDDEDEVEEDDDDEEEERAVIPDYEENNMPKVIRPLQPVPDIKMKDAPAEEKEWEFISQPEIAGFRNKKGVFLREHEAILELLNNTSEILEILRELK